MRTLNQALTFIKPHVVKNKKVVKRIEEIFNDSGITIVARRAWSAAEMCAQGVVDQHYSANARTGTCLDPSRLPVDEAARKEFATIFEQRWEDALASGNVASGQVALERLGISAEALNARWSKYKAYKIAGGLYVSHFVAEHLYVLNGFYPSMREIFTNAGATIMVLLVNFDPESLPWKRFRDEVIGVTNPAAADEASIRGLLYNRQQALGITVSYRENIIHASASAFEALCEKALWLPELPLAHDPLWQALEGSGITFERLRTWRDENPLLTLDGRTATLLDLFENLDTVPTAEKLRKIN